MGKINLMKGWYLSVPSDGRSYVLCETKKVDHSKIKHLGIEPKNDTKDVEVAWYGSLEQAIKGFRNIYGRKLLSAKETELSEAIDTLRKLDDSIEKLLRAEAVDGREIGRDLPLKSRANSRSGTKDEGIPTKKKQG